MDLVRSPTTILPQAPCYDGNSLFTLSANLLAFDDGVLTLTENEIMTVSTGCFRLKPPFNDCKKLRLLGMAASGGHSSHNSTTSG